MRPTAKSIQDDTHLVSPWKGRASKLALLLPGMLLLLLPSAGATEVGEENAEPVELQILALNDLHGNINSSFFFFGQSVGGVDYLATHLRALEAQADNTIFVSAGDLIGASPLISGLFHDEPTIEAANLLGMAVNAVGNHEFDEGLDELRRMQDGGCHPVDGCQDGDGFAGAEFQFLAANVVVDETAETFFPPVMVRNFQGVRVAFIGLTLEGTPSIVFPGAVAGVTFLDEADTINMIVPELQQIGIEAIVVLIHEGGAQAFSGGLNDCVNFQGPIVDIVNRTHPAVDLFITGHTSRFYNCVVDGRVVTSANSFGRIFTKIDVELNRVSKDMTVLAADNRLNTRDVEPAADVRALIDKYDSLSATLANAVIGTITADIFHNFTTTTGETALGDVVADSQLASTAPAGLGDADIAFMNPGGIRANLIFLASGTEADGEVTFAEAFAVQPFGNSLVTMTLTGAQIEQLLEMQFDNPFPGRNRILQPSAGFTYEWSASAPTGSKIDPASIELNGVVIDPGANYRVTVNSFLAGGGDNFGAIFTAGTDRLGGEIDLDAFVNYFANNSPVPPGPVDRIVLIP